MSLVDCTMAESCREELSRPLCCGSVRSGLSLGAKHGRDPYSSSPERPSKALLPEGVDRKVELPRRSYLHGGENR